MNQKVIFPLFLQIYRGDKANLAAQRGAVAVLIFTDPQAVKGESYPNGKKEEEEKTETKELKKGLGRVEKKGK